MKNSMILICFALYLATFSVFAEDTASAQPKETAAEESKPAQEAEKSEAQKETTPDQEVKSEEKKEEKKDSQPKEEPAYQPIIINEQPQNEQPQNEQPQNEPVTQTPPSQQAEVPPVYTNENPPVEPVPPAESIAQEASDEKTKKEEPKPFVKGELANVYSKDILYPYNSIGVRTGLTKIEDIYYLTINPTLAFNKTSLKMGFHAPFNLELLNTDVSKTKESEMFALRKQDWDEWQDYLKVIKYVQYGGTEDTFFFSMGQNFAYSLGHGTIMKRYISNFDPTTTRIAGKLNYYNDFMGFETVAGDIPTMTTGGALVFIKPLSLFCRDSYYCTSLSFGYTIAGDREAPRKMKYSTYKDYNPSDYFAGKDDRPPRLASDPDFDGRPVVEKFGTVYVQGFDVEFKFFKNDFVDIKGFADYSWIDSTEKREEFVEPETEIKNKSSSNGGLTLGFLGRFNLDEAKNHNMRLQLEFRHYDDSYIPSFFDSFYEAEQYEMLSNIYGVKDFRPDGKSKYAHLISDSEGKKVQSYYTELTYSYKNQFAIAAGLEKMPKTYNLFGHIEIPDFYFIKTMVTYSKRGITDLSNAFENDDISTLLRGVLRMEILPILFFNGYVGKQWLFWPEKKIREDDRLEGHFLSVWEWGFNIEVGYEF